MCPADANARPITGNQSLFDFSRERGGIARALKSAIISSAKPNHPDRIKRLCLAPNIWTRHASMARINNAYADLLKKIDS